MNNNQYNQNGQYQQPNGNNGGSFMDKVKNFILNTPVEQEPIAPQDIESNKHLSILAYIGILFWIPYVASNNSKFARFHSNQGFILFLTGIVLGVVNSIVGSILGVIPVIGSILAGIISVAIYLAEIGMMILGIYNCVKGRPNELPVIGKFRIFKTSPVNNGFNNNNYNNVNNNYNPNNNMGVNNMQNQGFNANAYSNGAQMPQHNQGFDANSYSNGAQMPQQNQGFDANAYSNGAQMPQQNQGFDANAYSTGAQMPQQNQGFDANAYSNGTDSSNNGNA